MNSVFQLRGSRQRWGGGHPRRASRIPRKKARSLARIMGHVLSVGTVFSTLQATGTLQSPPSSFSSLCFFFLPLPPPRGFRLRAKFRPRANGRAAFFVKRERERERFTRCSISISRRLLLRQIASRDENVNITWKNRNKLFFQVYFNERVEENGKEGREEQFITGRIGGVTVIRWIRAVLSLLTRDPCPSPPISKTNPRLVSLSLSFEKEEE